MRGGGGVRGDGRALVADLKFGGHRGAAAWIAAALAARLGTDPAPDVVTWVPTAPAHRHRRGGDQAEVLARAVGRRLRRAGPPAAASGATVRPRATRTSPAAGSARRWRPARPAPPVVLVVDDVVTTGGSARRRGPGPAVGRARHRGRGGAGPHAAVTRRG